MCAKSSDAAGQRGFTFVELIAVLLIVAALSAVAMPNLLGMLSFSSDSWHDQLVASLRHAQKTAVGHRRLVCASVAANGVTLSMASANPATSCNSALAGVDGQALAANGTGANAASVSPGGTLYFQPSGQVTSDGAGATPSSRSISISGESSISVDGATGHVQ